jgi:hypothetical protein
VLIVTFCSIVLTAIYYSLPIWSSQQSTTLCVK